MSYIYIHLRILWLSVQTTLGPECKAKKLSKWHNSPERNHSYPSCILLKIKPWFPCGAAYMAPNETLYKTHLFLTVIWNQHKLHSIYFKLLNFSKCKAPGKFSCANTTPMSAGMLSNPQVPTMWMPACTAWSWNWNCIFSKNWNKMHKAKNYVCSPSTSPCPGVLLQEPDKMLD